ncbi:MAG: ATP synthase F1 subunit epsilon [Oscillospiraceae bacterium]|jgi:F-type H+-transporting ATPase subunit epsilon|nr:ATP synthase F1 subunit epsilon [Oscillospiraceae bacterium]
MADFPLEILTPEREFFSSDVEALTVTLPDGLLTVLAGHRPMVAALDPGELRYKKDGDWSVCACSEGFLEVEPGRVRVFVQSCERPDEIDENRAKAAYERESELYARKQSLREHELTRLALARAMTRLAVSGKNKPHF